MNFDLEQIKMIRSQYKHQNIIAYSNKFLTRLSRLQILKPLHLPIY